VDVKYYDKNSVDKHILYTAAVLHLCIMMVAGWTTHSVLYPKLLSVYNNFVYLNLTTQRGNEYTSADNIIIHIILLKLYYYAKKENEW